MSVSLKSQLDLKGDNLPMDAVIDKICGEDKAISIYIRDSCCMVDR